MIVRAGDRVSIRCVYDDLLIKEPEITNAVFHASSCLDCRLVDLDHSVKSMASIQSKLFRMGGYGNPYQDFSDLIRYTCVMKGSQMEEAVSVLQESLKEKGCYCRKTENFFLHPKDCTLYRGLHLDFVSHDGYPFEIQLHTNLSYLMKKILHPYYVLTRDYLFAGFLTSNAPV